MKDRALIEAVLKDWRMAPVNPALRATLSFLETLALRPDDVSAEAILQMREAGVSEEGIEQAIVICAIFSVADRLADTFDYAPPDPRMMEKAGEQMLIRGYK